MSGHWNKPVGGAIGGPSPPWRRWGHRVPVFLVEGRHDHEAPSSLAAKYFDVLRAPSKELIWFERSAHLPNWEEPAGFIEFMVTTIRPLCGRGDAAPVGRSSDRSRPGAA